MRETKKIMESTSSEDIFSSRKHSMDYFTVDGVILRTGYSNKRDWYVLCIRELLDNAADFLSVKYIGADDTFIDVDIFKDDNLFRLKVTNSNYNNTSVFSNLEAIFDYDMRYGSKQNTHIVSRGILGDAMKQILSFGYVLTNVSRHDVNGFVDKQWKHPLIISHNKKRFKIYLKVDTARQIGKSRIEESPEKAHTHEYRD